MSEIDRIAALEAENERLREGLNDVVNPIARLERFALAEGCQIDGRAAVTLADDPNFLKSIARGTLAALTQQGTE